MSCASVSQLPAVSIADTLACQKGIVDLWYYFYADCSADLLAAHDALLSPGEHFAHERFHFDRDRRQFLATRALVRTVLSGYSNVSPNDWRFTAGDFGRPHISEPQVTPTIHFNLSNTHELVVCAVSVAHEELGVDVERIDREVDAAALSQRYFSAYEASEIQSLPLREQQGRFFSYWTLKESYMKARGVGLGLPLDQISFLWENGIKVDLDPRLSDDAASWRFALLDAPPHHMIAISVRTDGPPLSLRASQVVPLGENPT